MAIINATMNQNPGIVPPIQQKPTPTQTPPVQTGGGYTQGSAGQVDTNSGIITGTQGYTAAQLGNAQNWNVDNNQLVENRIGNIVRSDSPLMQMSRTQALQDMNSRGLVNSSMAIGAGQTAVYNAALPIAQQDAGTYAKSAAYNADIANQFAQQNMLAQNKALEFNANASNQAGQTNATNITQTNIGRGHDLTQLQYGREKNATDITTTGMNNQTSLQVGREKNATDIQVGAGHDATSIGVANIDRDKGIQVAGINANAQIVTTGMNNATQIQTTGMNNAAQITATGMNNATQKEVAQIQGQFQNQINGSNAAAQLFNDFQHTMASIDQSNLDQASKDAAKTNAKQNLADGMRTLATTANIPSLAQIYPPSSTAPAAAPAPAPAPAPTANSTMPSPAVQYKNPAAFNETDNYLQR